MKKYILLISIVIILSSGSVFSQSKSSGLNFHWMNGTKTEVIQQPSQDVSDELKTQAQILAELKVQRAVNAEKDKQIAALNGQIGSQGMTITLLTEQRDFYKTASSERKQAGTLDDQNILLLRQQIADDRQEIKDLRNENDKLRSSRDTRTWLSLIAGAGLGYAAHK
jgi:hypothetical protein